jgi:hypothetical protein
MRLNLLPRRATPVRLVSSPRSSLRGPVRQPMFSSSTLPIDARKRTSSCLRCTLVIDARRNAGYRVAMWRAFAWTLFALSTMATPDCTCSRPSESARSGPAWTIFEDPHHRFRCELPRMPDRHAPPPALPGGPRLDSWVLRIDANTSYSIATTDYGNVPLPDADHAIDAARDSILRTYEATLVREQAIQSLDAIGREVVADAVGARSLRARLYLRRNALIQLVAVHPANASPVGEERFFASFELTH